MSGGDFTGMKYCFGPVNSRRLGLSLGVDLVPAKTCNLDCVYCECGRTTNKAVERREYVPLRDVAAELDEILSAAPRLDAVTFSGAGEPTLHTGIGELIRYVRSGHPRYAVAVLTNGTLLHLPEVRQALLPADVVVPSLDAVSPAVFEKMLRPAPGVTPSGIIDGIAAFRREYAGKLVVEIFIIPGVNDGEEELTLLREACMKIGPDVVELNTLHRPSSETWVSPAGEERLREIALVFSPLTAVPVGQPPPPGGVGLAGRGAADDMLSLLSRRPSTVDDLVRGLGLPEKEVRRLLAGHVARGLVRCESAGGREFYRAV